jgi:predicted MFS family arabinose efflux permease
VVPLFAEQAGSERGAGLATVALLFATVACELVTPRLVARLGYRPTLVLGLVLLGAPTLALTLSGSLYVIVAVSVVRGAGFAVCTVAGGALTATMIPEGRRGEGLALVGLISGVSGLLALPAGVWAAGRWGYPPVFVVTATVTLLALVSVPALPGRVSGDTASGHRGVAAGLRRPAMTRPAAIFASSTVAVGVLVTFLPLATAGRPAWLAPAALLAQPAAATAARWGAGRLGDRRGPARLLVPGLVLAVIGMVGVAATGAPAAVIAGSLAFGAGFGILQNTTLALMYDGTAAGDESTVSAVWNTAYDLGMGSGALVAGLVVTSIGYSMTFVLAAVAMLPAFALVRRIR